MKWTTPNKPSKYKSKPKAGDTKLLQKFIFSPKSYWNPELKQTEWFWLQKVYLYYRYYEEEFVRTPWGSEQYVPAKWVREGVTDSFSIALNRGWIKT